MTTDNLDQVNAALKLNNIRRAGVAVFKGQEREGQKHKSQELKDFENISEKFDKRRTDTERLYRAEYTTRVEIARRALIDKAGSKVRDFKPSFGMIDRFNSRDLTRQAQLNVRSDHQRSMDRLDSQELKESETFLEKSSQRKKYIKDFKHSSERRRTQSRRESPERRRSPSQTMGD